MIAHWTKEAVKVIRSFLYFVTTYVQIEDKVGGSAIPFALWPSQISILPKFLSSRRLIILKARQLGLTWLTAAYCVWLAITKPLQLIVVISAKEEWAIEFIDRCKFITARLPSWLLPKLTKETSQILEFAHARGTVSVIKSLATTPEGAQSKTPTMLVMDESAVNRYAKEIYASSKPGIDAGGGRIIVISNAIKTAPGWPWTRGIYTGSMSGANDFERIFMDPFAHPGRNPKTFIKEQLAQGMDEEDVSMHYPLTELEAISPLSGSYFGKVLSRHTMTCEGIKGRLVKNRETQELEFTQDPKGVLEIWRYPYWMSQEWNNVHWKDRYAIGSDNGEGLGYSDSVAYVKDRLLDEYVARMRSSRIDASDWATMLHELSKYYHNGDNRDALICPARKGPGITTCKELTKANANLYVKLIPAKVGGEMTREIGWQETRESKWELAQDLKTWLKTMRGTLYCGVLIDQCSTFIRHDNGELAAEEGKLDDAVIAAGVTEQACRFIGQPSREITHGPSGWLKRWQEGEI